MVRHALATPATISTLRADIVPKREMAIRKWYFASPLWHYHQRGFPGDFHCDANFYRRIDPELRPLCQALHSAGIATTPSCQGHFHDRDHFLEVWNELKREEGLIRSEGLVVRDSASEREFLFRASTYELPWEGFDEYHSQIAAQQTAGYLGILVPRDRSAVVCRLHNRPLRMPRATVRFDGDLSCILGGSLFAAVVDARDPDECSALWKEVARYINSVLAEPMGRPLHFRPGVSGRMSH